MLIDLDELVSAPIQRLRVVPDVTARKAFSYTIDQTDQLTLFRDSVKRAESGEPSGHNRPIFEADLILENGDLHTRFPARVYEWEPDDLFLQRRSETRDSDGSWSLDELVQSGSQALASG